MKTLLVTGSNGLIGSEMVNHFHGLGWTVHGVDNNMRADFFGSHGDHALEPRSACAVNAIALHITNSTCGAGKKCWISSVNFVLRPRFMLRLNRATRPSRSKAIR